MVNVVINVYNSEELNGECLIQPLKIYQNFFARKIEHASGLKKLAWLVAKVVGGIFAYPIFGVLAGLGILVKLIDVYNLKQHNQSEKERMNGIRIGLKHSNGYGTNCSTSIIQLGWEMKVVQEFKVTKQNVDGMYTAIHEAIDDFSNQCKKIYVASRGYINGSHQEIIVQLKVMERV